MSQDVEITEQPTLHIPPRHRGHAPAPPRLCAVPSAHASLRTTGRAGRRLPSRHRVMADQRGHQEGRPAATGHRRVRYPRRRGNGGGETPTGWDMDARRRGRQAGGEVSRFEQSVRGRGQGELACDTCYSGQGVGCERADTYREIHSPLSAFRGAVVSPFQGSCAGHFAKLSLAIRHGLVGCLGRFKMGCLLQVYPHLEFSSVARDFPELGIRLLSCCSFGSFGTHNFGEAHF